MAEIASYVGWGTTPTIAFDFSYEKKREDKSQYYKITVSCRPVNGNHYFGYPIYVDIKLDGTSKASYTLKNAAPYKWDYNISNTTGWLEVPNKIDGTTSISIYIYSGLGSSRAGTYTYSLPIDPAASKIGATDANIESTSTISITRYDNGFTTTVGYKAAGQSEYTTIWTKQKHTSYGWTVPASLYSIMPKLREIEVELRCQTYSGDTLIGTNYGTMTATANSTKCQPEASISAKDIRAATVGLTGSNRKIIKGVSTLEATVTSKAIKSATLVNTTVTCGSKQQVSTSNPFVATFAKAESATATSATKDSRDYVTWEKDELTLINYVSPTANQIASRENPTSDVVNVSLSGIWFNDSFGSVTNNLVAKVRSKPKGQSSYTSSYTTMSVTSNGNNYTASAKLTGLVYTEAYDIEIVVTDAVHNGSIEAAIVKYDEVRKGIPIFDWGENDFNVNGALMINRELNVAEEVTKYNKCVVKKYWWGAAGSTLDTGISAKGESYGKTILVVLSAHSGAGTATSSEVGMIWCGFDSGTIVYTCLASISGGSTVSSQFTFSVGSDGNIYLKGERPVIAMTAIISD